MRSGGGHTLTASGSLPKGCVMRCAQGFLLDSVVKGLVACAGKHHGVTLGTVMSLHV